MFKKKINLWQLALLFLVLVISLLPFSLAWSPDTHFNITIGALNEQSSTPIKDIINRNREACYNGIIEPDIKVVYYFSNFKEYAASHSWTYCDKLISNAITEKEKSYAYCNCLHLVQDTVSHNFFVTNQIKSTWMPNGLIHPLSEEKVELLIQTPDITRIRESSMDDIESYVAITAKSLGENKDSISRQSDFLRGVLSSDKFYESGFRATLAIPASVYFVLFSIFILNLLYIILLFRIRKKNWFIKIILPVLLILELIVLFIFIGILTARIYDWYRVITKPFIGLIPQGNYEQALELSRQYTRDFLRGSRPPLNPSGEEALVQAVRDAGKGIGFIRFVVIAGILYMVFWSVRRFLKERR